METKTIKPRRQVILILTSILIAGFFVSHNAFSEEKQILLKTPLAFSSQLPALGSSILYISEQLEIISGGSIRMKPFEPNTLVAPFEILDAVSTGKLNSGYTTAGYWAGTMPAAPIFTTVPFGPTLGEYVAWFYQGDGLRLYQEMYDAAGYKVKVLPCSVLSAETAGWFKKPIDSVEDFKGLNIRFYGLGARVLEKLGASTSLLPAGELFGALEKGVIDATEFSMPAIDYRLGLHKVAKYNYFPGWHQQTTFGELLLHKPTWESMSKRQQTIVETVCRASIITTLSLGEWLQPQFMQKAQTEHGVNIRKWTPQQLDAFRQAWNEVVEEERQKDAFFKKVWDNLNDFREKYSIWKRNAFLPLE